MDGKILADVFKYTPEIDGVWRFIPLHRLPRGACLLLDVHDHQPEIPRLVNGEDETNLFHPPAGRYKLIAGDYPTMFFSMAQTTLVVKPYFQILAPGSRLVANFLRNGENFCLTTGLVWRIMLEDTPVCLTYP